MEIIPLITGFIHVPGHRFARYPGLVVTGPVVVCAYLVRIDGLTILFDTGIAVDPEADQHYRPVVIPVADSLAALGTGVSDIDLIVNCHLHTDHAGGNHLFPGVPVLVQTAELEAVYSDDGYTVARACLRYDGAHIERLAGRKRISDHVEIVPLPGHSPGHQGLVLRGRDETVLLAGQATDEASQFATAWLACVTVGLDRHPDYEYPDWMHGLVSANIDAAVFAHDTASWRRPATPLARGRRPEIWAGSADHEVAPLKADQLDAV